MECIDNESVLYSVIAHISSKVIKENVVPEVCYETKVASVLLVLLENGTYAVCDKSHNEGFYTSLWYTKEEALSHFYQSCEWFNITSDNESCLSSELAELDAECTTAIAQIISQHSHKKGALVAEYWKKRDDAETVLNQGHVDLDTNYNNAINLLRDECNSKKEALGLKYYKAS